MNRALTSEAAMRWLRRAPMTVYSCGNCREKFPSQEAVLAHQPCPLYLIEKEVAEYNRLALAVVTQRLLQEPPPTEVVEGEGMRR